MKKEPEIHGDSFDKKQRPTSNNIVNRPNSNSVVNRSNSQNKSL
jgi:ribulose bisphosphate carboxylase small subunit